MYKSSADPLHSGHILARFSFHNYFFFCFGVPTTSFFSFFSPPGPPDVITFSVSFSLSFSHLVLLTVCFCGVNLQANTGYQILQIDDLFQIKPSTYQRWHFFCHSLEFLRFILYIFNETTFTFSLCYILFRSFISLPFYCPPLQSHINQ